MEQWQMWLKPLESACFPVRQLKLTVIFFGCNLVY